MKKYPWFEIWFDYQEPPYLLILLPDMQETRFDVYDPLEDRVCHSAKTYEDACSWLWEDEFRRVEGRIGADD
jgi:hypothetical protein